jgi:glycosyltransferase involved in cell wall biosynthesis
MEKIDVVMPTWNANGWWFPKVLRSIKRNCEVCHLVVVDRQSTDGTVETLKSIFKSDELRIIESEANLAQARETGIRNVDTRLFAFIDSDIEICEDWFGKLYPFIARREIGAVQAKATDDYGSHQPSTGISEFQSSRNVSFYMTIRYGLFNLIRGMTTQTLIKTALVSDWHPDPRLNSFEDFHITQHVISTGHKWIRVNNDRIIGMHHRYPKDSETELDLFRRWNRWNGAGARLAGAADLPHIIVNSIARLAGEQRRFLKKEISSRQLVLLSFGQFWVVQGFLSYTRSIADFRGSAYSRRNR